MVVTTDRELVLGREAGCKSYTIDNNLIFLLSKA
jgi:hypothetical protein